MKLHWQILSAIVLAIIIGVLLSPESALFGITYYAFFDFFGELFLNGLMMIVVPLILSSIISGVAAIGGGRDFGRLGGKTLGFFMVSSTSAILVGLLLVNLTTPGLIDGEPAGPRLNLVAQDEAAAALAKVEGRGGADIAAVFLRMIPTNVVDAAASGEMLGLIFFAMLFGFFMSRLPSETATTLKSFWQGVFDVMMAITLLVMKFAPIGVFALVANTVMVTGFEAFGPLLVFFLTVVAALAIHMFITMALALRFAARVNPFKHYRAMMPALLTAFSTASSAATLPLTIERMEKNVGVSNKSTSFVLPLGATINMDGTALYECVAAIFIAQAYGLDLSFAQQFLIVVIALITSVGVAGVPAASLVAISVILMAIGLPLEGIALLLVTDRLLDMMRTAVNVFSDTCCAVWVARSEGETGLYPVLKSEDSSR